MIKQLHEIRTVGWIICGPVFTSRDQKWESRREGGGVYGTWDMRRGEDMFMDDLTAEV